MFGTKLCWCSILLSSFFYNVCYSQNGVDVPVVYLNQFNTFLTTNPSSIVDTSTLEMGAFYNAYAGAFSKIRNFEAYCFYRPSAKSSWLLEMNSDQQGPSFKKNKFYGGYMQQVPFSEKLNAQVGAKIGMVNYLFKPSQSGIGGSDFGLDGSLSFSLFTKNWLIGSALHQFTSTKLQPIEQLFILEDYWETQGYYLFEKPNYTIKTGLRGRFTSIQNVYQASTQIECYSLLVGGSVSNLGYTMSLGYAGKTPNFENQKTLISFLYYIPSVENLKVINQNRFEVILKVFINR